MAFFVTLLIYAALFILSDLLRQKPKDNQLKPGGLGDFNFPTATENRIIPVIWGTVKMQGPNVVWYGDLDVAPIIKKIKTGMFSSKKQTIGFYYNVGIHMAWARSPIGSSHKLRKIWIDQDLVYTNSGVATSTVQINEPELFGGNELGNGGFTADIDWYDGSETQSTNDYLAQFQNSGAGTDRLPAYNATAAFVVRQYNAASAAASKGAYVGNSTSIKPIYAELQRLPNGLGLSSGDAFLNGGLDCNPMNVLYELITDPEIGMGESEDVIDLDNFTTAAETLADEGNGFSYVCDNVTDIPSLFKLIEEQIDGVVFLDPAVGKFRVKLARADYNIDDALQLTDATVIEIQDHSVAMWSDTSNVSRVIFNDRNDDYKERPAIAQDMANQMVQGAGTAGTALSVPNERKYPGVKVALLANAIAWRDLRTLAYPLVRATLAIGRIGWSVTPGQVVAWTNSRHGYTKLPMRVTRIDYGQIESGRVILTLVQDIFKYAAGSFAPPPGTGWTPPADSLDAFGSTEQVVFEAPRAIITRDPEYNGTVQARVWGSGKRPNNASGFEIRQRNSSGVTSGSYADAGTVYGFLEIGTLTNDLDAGSAYPLATLAVTAAPSSQDDIIDAIVTATKADLGQNLTNLVLVNDEFMLVSAAQVAGSNVTFLNVYRGVLDSVQGYHSAGDKIYLVGTGGGLSDTAFPKTNNVDIKLSPFSFTDQVADGSITTVSFALVNRANRPYPPATVEINSVDWDIDPSLEGSGSGFDALGLSFDFIRRNYLTDDEVASLNTDAGTLTPTFPAANTTVYDVSVRVDPAGTNTLVRLSTKTDPPFVFTRTEILKAAGGSVPADLRVTIRAFHDADGETELQSVQSLVFDFQPTSGLSGQFEFGSLDSGDVSAAYTAAATGTFVLTIGTALAGPVQARINGGSWTTIITTGNTTGNIAGVSSSDTIEIRHTSAASSELTFVELKNPSATPVAFGVLFD